MARHYRIAALLALPLVVAGLGSQARDPDVEFEEIARLLRVTPGARIADVGAGGGGWTFRLARRVGATGVVYSTEVKVAQVDGIRRSARARDLGNVVPILGTQHETRLPEDCCDAVLLRLVYHAFDHPERMVASLRQAVKPGGKLLVIDFRPTPERLVDEMGAAGFETERVIDRWQGQAGVYAVLFAEPPTEPPEPVSFPTPDGGVVHADLYGDGDHGVVLVHGGRFDKSSWEEQAGVLADAGLRVLAIDLRGKGRSRGGTDEGGSLAEGYHLDVLAAVRYLRGSGATEVSVVGGSLGGWAAARAAVEAEPGEIDRLVLLAHASIEEPERMQGRKLFVTTRGDVRGEGVLRLPEIRDQYERAPGPKELMVLEGSAHAQFLFDTGQGQRLMREIVRFLSEP